jgi:hypothetical protein
VNDFKGDKPQQGDTVEATFKGVWLGGHPEGGDALAVGDEVLRIPFTASVEVLERADDPSKDLVGTLRREDHGERGHSIWQRIEDMDGDAQWWCTFSTATGNRWQRLDSVAVRGFPVIGSVAGTPAAEAEAREKAVGAAVLREKIRHEEDKQARRDASWPKPAARVFRSEGSEPPEAEYAREADVEAAMRAAESGSAGHWPTVSAVLADEVRRLRGGAS